MDERVSGGNGVSKSEAIADWCSPDGGAIWGGFLEGQSVLRVAMHRDEAGCRVRAGPSCGLSVASWNVCAAFFDDHSFSSLPLRLGKYNLSSFFF